jgi:methylenetetrahydrofolate dehydrogenase (NADP+) / methenyltetrahydrofolate cyclohydrolase
MSTSPTIIDGKAVAARVRENLADEIAGMQTPPGLATILVGDDPASAIYVRSKRRMCVELGMRDLHQHLPATTSQAELEQLVTNLSEDPAVTGILVQLPLPEHMDARAVIRRIAPDKDVDGLTGESVARLASGRPGLRPCTPSGVMRMLDEYGVRIEGTDTVVVGRSDLVGRPMAQMLLERDATVTSCHKGTRDLRAATRRADILVVAAGVPGLITGDDVKPGVTVIDVGINRVESGIVGDVDFASVAPLAWRISPVPGGVGPMTIAMLMANTVQAAHLQGQAAPQPV